MGRVLVRDRVARTELRCERVYVDGESATCGWCGSVPYFTPNGRRYLHVYYLEHDSVCGRRDDYSGRFCSVSCMRSYHT